MQSNETFEVPVPVDSPSVLGFTFEVENDGSVEFSVVNATGVKMFTGKEQGRQSMSSESNIVYSITFQRDGSFYVTYRARDSCTCAR